ncbi:unnamed protein product [Adineta ricciae]|uniref:UAS domain-containing protein n=1 Tax=Adineta ricciae TaxID=249248 RepID=A0A815TG12_ADIRI|nr:unnamed protein product [Adineta ricciae]
MDDYTDTSDDEIFHHENKSNSNEKNPFPSECTNEADGIESFHRCFTERYHSCPIFFYGSLSKACEIAFNSLDITKHRPVLVYIHHEKSALSNMFCKQIFCSEVLTEFLMENYIVWPWDITLRSNEIRLSAIWKELFGCPLLADFSADKYPMLFGITRRLPGRKLWSLEIEYQFTSLMKSDKLIRTQEIVALDTFVSELITFKEQCDQIEQTLMFNINKENNNIRNESFSACLQQRYQNCPTFFMGFLQDACKLIHNPILNKECRPVLIYLHNDENFHSEMINPISIIDYLLEDFIVYPFDITSESNEEIIKYMWIELFKTSFFPKSYQKKLSIDLWMKLLINSATLNLDKTFLKQLFDFKEKFHENEKILSYDFLKDIRLPFNIIPQISKYFTLNELITLFSTEIIPLLNEFQVKVHLSDSSHELLNMIYQRLRPGLIISIMFNTKCVEICLIRALQMKSIYEYSWMKCICNTKITSERMSITNNDVFVFNSFHCIIDEFNH